MGVNTRRDLEKSLKIALRDVGVEALRAGVTIPRCTRIRQAIQRIEGELRAKKSGGNAAASEAEREVRALNRRRSEYYVTFGKAICDQCQDEQFPERVKSCVLRVREIYGRLRLVDADAAAPSTKNAEPRMEEAQHETASGSGPRTRRKAVVLAAGLLLLTSFGVVGILLKSANAPLGDSVRKTFSRIHSADEDAQASESGKSDTPQKQVQSQTKAKSAMRSLSEQRALIKSHQAIVEQRDLLQEKGQRLTQISQEFNTFHEEFAQIGTAMQRVASAAGQTSNMQWPNFDRKKVRGTPFTARELEVFGNARSLRQGMNQLESERQQKIAKARFINDVKKEERRVKDWLGDVQRRYKGFRARRSGAVDYLPSFQQLRQNYAWAGSFQQSIRTEYDGLQQEYSDLGQEMQTLWSKILAKPSLYGMSSIRAGTRGQGAYDITGGGGGRSYSIDAHKVDKKVRVVNFDVSEVVAVFLVADLDLTIETNDPNLPDNTLQLAAGVPYFWDANAQTSNSFTVDVDALFVTNNTDSAATLEVDFLRDMGLP